MDWGDIVNIVIGIVMAAVVAIGLPLALHRRKKEGPKKRDELCHHLQEIGVNVTLPEDESDKRKIGEKRSSMERPQGIIEIKGRSIDWINIIGVASEYGTSYFLDYLVKTPNLALIKLKKTVLKKKRQHSLEGRSLATRWVGDSSLSQSLNFDHRLENRLMQSEFKGPIRIFPEPKYGYTRIRTSYFLPSPNLFEAIDIIAQHIRSKCG
jgi:hypothetical protein